MTRMKKMTMKKSSLQGSDLAWVLKADCTDFMVRVNRFGPILPPLVGSLVHGVPVPFFSLSEETVKAERPWLTTYRPPQTSALLFFSGRGGETLLETTCYSLLILYRPLTAITIYPESFAISPLLHKRILLSRFWFSLTLFCHHHRLVCADQLRVSAENNSAVVPSASLLL